MNKIDSMVHGNNAQTAGNDDEKNEVACTIAGHKITWERVRDVLCNALEGGSNYWYLITDFVPPAVGDVPWAGETQRFRHIDYPVRAGGALIIQDNEQLETPESHRVDRDALVRGLHIMAEKHLRHFCDLVLETDDAETADVLLQCTVFGEVIYG